MTDRPPAASTRASRWSALAAELGAREITFVLSLGLIAVGLWQIYRPAAPLVVGLVLLWIVLPVRAPFVQRSALPVDDATRHHPKAVRLG